MKFKFKQFFELAEAAGIEAAEADYYASTSTEINVFQGVVDQFSVDDGARIVARGIVNGKFGAASTERIDSKLPDN